MKRRVRIRRMDGVRQRYWVGKKLRKNYGSQIIRQRIRKDIPKLSGEEIEDIEFGLPSPDKILPSSYRREEIVRTFEKNPELYKEFRETKPKILFIKGRPSRTHPRERVILISDPRTRGWMVYDKKRGEYNIEGIEPDLRHELRHLSDFDLVGDFNKWKNVIPDSLKESSTTSAEYISKRHQKIPKRVVRYNVEKFMENRMK